MARERFRFERVDAAHDRSSFECGVPALDRYFREKASQDLRRDLASVTVLLDVGENRIAGYYTLSAFVVDPAGLPEDYARRVPRRPLPATLLGRLAVDLRYRGRGFGGHLLLDAMRRMVRASADVAIAALVVDAKDASARSFYERYGFRRFADDELRLFLPLRVALAALDAPDIR